MSNTLSKTIQDLEEQKKRIDSALRVLRGLNQTDGRSQRGTRAISEAGRKRIADAQKRRWAKIRATKKSSQKSEA